MLGAQFLKKGADPCIYLFYKSFFFFQKVWMLLFFSVEMFLSFSMLRGSIFQKVRIQIFLSLYSFLKFLR